jgi:Homeodomain-like domain-containing protein
VRSPAEVENVLELARGGLSQSAIARVTGISRTTVRDWLAGYTPAVRDGGVDSLPRGPYAYLLGLYLGDGFIATGPRTTCLRIFFDACYPGIIGECVRAIRAVRPGNRVWVARRVPTRCVVVQC